jgi:hypothetical protein
VTRESRAVNWALAEIRVRGAATAAAKYLGAQSVRRLLIWSAIWFGLLTVSYLVYGRPLSWTIYAWWALGWITGAVVYRSAKRAWQAWSSSRRA